MLEHKICLKCTEGEDYLLLRQSLLLSGIKLEAQTAIHQENSMGIEEIIIALISSAVIPSLLDVIKVWMSGRKKELIIKDINSGKEVKLISNDGKGLSEEDLIAIQSIFKK